MNSRVKNQLFDPSDGFERGRNAIIYWMWLVLKVLFFNTAFPWPSTIKCSVLRLFGAEIGSGVVIKPRVSIQFPWKLKMGDYCWIGEGVMIVNFEKIVMGNSVTISQNALLCSGGHDYRSVSMRYRNGAIAIQCGAWVCAGAIVTPNVNIGIDCVVTAGCIVTKNIPDGKVITRVREFVYYDRWR